MKKQVLILDDSPIVNQMHSYIIENMGHEVMDFINGDDAIDFLTDTNKDYPDLIIVDHHLTSINNTRKTGLTLLKTLKKCGVYIPVIVSSGITDERIKNKYKEMGASDYVDKGKEDYIDDMVDSINKLI